MRHTASYRAHSSLHSPLLLSSCSSFILRSCLLLLLCNTPRPTSVFLPPGSPCVGSPSTLSYACLFFSVPISRIQPLSRCTPTSRFSQLMRHSIRGRERASSAANAKQPHGPSHLQQHVLAPPPHPILTPRPRPTPLALPPPLHHSHCLVSTLRLPMSARRPPLLIPRPPTPSILFSSPASSLCSP